MACRDFESRMKGAPLFMTNGAISTELKFKYGVVPDRYVSWSDFVLREKDRLAVSSLMSGYVEIAKRHSLPIFLLSPSRRANREQVERFGACDDINERGMRFFAGFREQGEDVYCGALMGCRGDAYSGEGHMGAREAKAFHAWQARRLASASPDFLYAGIMPALPETVGLAQAMSETGVPYIISFMITDNGGLLDGTTLHEAITAIDAQTERKPLCYMVNCVHPRTLRATLSKACNQTDEVRERFWGIRANSSKLPPYVLDGNAELMTSDPDELADDMIALARDFKLSVLGGCCGTEYAHMETLAARMEAAVKGGAGETRRRLLQESV